MWWDVFDERFDIAFSRGEEDSRLDWDVELELGACGLASCSLPDCIEDGFLPKLADLVMSSFTQQNPISIDFSGSHDDDDEDDDEDEF